MPNICNFGFIQGRLSPKSFGRIQTFPVGYWKEEIYAASRLGINKIEWTIDSITLDENPIVDSRQFTSLRKFSETYQFSIDSVTCDFFMENPPWNPKFVSNNRVNEVFATLLDFAEFQGPLVLVVPILDNSSLPTLKSFESIVEIFERLQLDKFPVKVAFESDIQPKDFYSLIKDLDPNIYGVNLDIGNSAAYGFNPMEEIDLLSGRIFNIHLKDRPLSGNSCRFGTGHTNFSLYLELLKDKKYCGNLILQSYRPTSGYFFEELLYSLRFTKRLMGGECLAA